MSQSTYPAVINVLPIMHQVLTPMKRQRERERKAQKTGRDNTTLEHPIQENIIHHNHGRCTQQ